MEFTTYKSFANKKFVVSSSMYNFTKYFGSSIFIDF